MNDTAARVGPQQVGLADRRTGRAARLLPIGRAGPAEAVAVGIGERLGVRVDAATTLSGRGAGRAAARGRISAGRATDCCPPAMAGAP